MKFLICFFLLCSIMEAFSQNKHQSDWQKVDSLANLGQPQSALEIINRLYDGAKKSGQTGPFIKTVIYRMKLEADFQEDFYKTAIDRTKNEITQAGSPEKQILNSILAELYWHYFQQNRWKVLRRSETSNFTEEDISTWDARKLVSAGMENYTLSLAGKELLKNQAIASFSEMLVQQKGSGKYRPTLFDFLAHRAIDFYTSNEAGLTTPANTFVINKAQYFSPFDVFSTLTIDSPDSFSFDFQALKLMQETVGFHQNDADPTALIDADLERLSFVHKKCTLTEKDSLYLAALDQLEKRFHDHPASTEIACKIAAQLNEENYQTNEENPLELKTKWNKKRAVEICKAAIVRFPESFGAKNCRALLESIQQPALSVSISNVVVPDKPSLALVTYKNSPKVYFRLLKIDPKTDQDLREKDNEDRLGQYLKIHPENSWEQALPDDGDYRQHSAEVKIPATPSGYYILLGSNDPAFPKKKAVVFSTSFWSSNISYISRNEKETNEIIVLHRESGQPMAGTNVQPFYKEYSQKNQKWTSVAGEIQVTDKDGKVTVKPHNTGKRHENYFIKFTTKTDQLITDEYYNYYYQEQEPQSVTQTYFFTDRAIYRPGQTVYFKGITLERKNNDVKIKPGYSTVVMMYDANNQIVSKQTLTTNDFGSFAGSFTAPQNVLTGSMEIRNETGVTEFRVEEYKRPKFEVNFEPVKGSYKLGAPVTVTGKAMAYAGSPVSAGKVKYRVVREIHFPYFWNVGRYMSRQTDMELTNGETETAADGSFKITFDALPDNSFDKKSQPVFSYTVKAGVTDINGETHEAETTISAGYQSLLINTNLTDEVNLEKGFQFSLKTTNLNGEKLPASGTIRVSRLQSPGHVLYKRKWDRPDRFTMTKNEFNKTFPNEVYNNEDDKTTWEKEAPVYSADFSTPNDSLIRVKSVQPGNYVVEINTKDAFGENVVYTKYISTFEPQNGKTETTDPLQVNLLTPTAEPGENVRILVGSPENKARILYEIVQNNKIIDQQTLHIDDEQKLLIIPVKEEYRGNFSVNLTMVRNNRFYTDNHLIKVPFSNKKLDIQIASFRSKLTPGQNEEWQVTLHDAHGEKIAGELLASMYDSSLDEFAPHNWNFNLYNFYYGYLAWGNNQTFNTEESNPFYSPELQNLSTSRKYDQLNWFGFGNRYSGGGMRHNMLKSARGANMDTAAVMEAPAGAKREDNASELMVSDEQVATVVKYVAPVAIGTNEKADAVRTAKKTETPKTIQMRKNLNETAFFYPQLATNEKGEVVLKFKAPEALTRWKLMALAHTKDLKYGQVEKTLVTQKDLMVFVNVPRFLREGDRMEFAAKVSNISGHDLSGTAELHFFDAFTMQNIDNLVDIKQTVQPFSANKGLSASVSWTIHVPEGLQAVVYRVTASSGSFSDGEEAAIPVLTNRILVTESLPLPVNGNQQKTFSFEKLLNSDKSSTTLKNYRLSLEYTSNPAWYAMQALPYLMEYPYECAEQLFSRFYANSLATYMANSNPKIKRIFESWKNISPGALTSNLEKNEELKSVLLQESPWVNEAKNETEQKQRISLLFDLNRMSSEQEAALKKLADMQYENGGWPWFKDMPESRYITQHIVSGFAHLAGMKVFNPEEKSQASEMIKKAIGFLDKTFRKDFEQMKKDDSKYLENNHLCTEDIQYLYARSYFLKDFPINKANNEVTEYYLSQTEKYWNTQNNYMKAMMALYLNRTGKGKTASLIMRSLKETALHSDEMGMYWRDEPHGWFWHQAPVETQALLIEAFDEVARDEKSVEEMKTWLLKQKQTQNWKTTKATTEAVYALLRKGTDLLAPDQPVEISLGGQKTGLHPTASIKPEAGTGYFKTSWDGASITPEMGKITVSNPNPVAAWGAMYWQYFEQTDHITSAQTPLRLNKKLFVERHTPTGPVIEPIAEGTPIRIGDKIVVRIELRTNRDMEYIHLKDMRAAAFEPVNVLSGYRYQDGLGYYESTRDASTNFFISRLPKGTYIFEYKLIATQKGDFSNGTTSVQCMYAPEFAAHSDGNRVKVE